MQNDACSTVHEKPDFLLKQMSKRWGYFAGSPVIVSPSVDEVSGKSERGSGWRSKSPLQDCSVLVHSTRRGPGDLELCASFARGGVAARDSIG